jgi:hypothetical protein
MAIAHDTHGRESLLAAIDALCAPPLVTFVDGYFEFHHEGRAVYDFRVIDQGDALRWIEHVAGKTWVTKEHLEQFARLAATHFGAPYR